MLLCLCQVVRSVISNNARQQQTLNSQTLRPSSERQCLLWFCVVSSAKQQTCVMQTHAKTGNSEQKITAVTVAGVGSGDKGMKLSAQANSHEKAAAAKQQIGARVDQESCSKQGHSQQCCQQPLTKQCCCFLINCCDVYDSYIPKPCSSLTVLSHVASHRLAVPPLRACRYDN